MKFAGYRCRFIAIVSFLFVSFFSNPLLADTAPAFDLPTTTSNISLNKLAGKVVYLDFWASWCTPCRKSFPWMQEMQAKYKDKGLVIVAVNLDKSKEKADEFIKEFDNNFIIAFDPEGSIAEKYKVMGMPSSYLIDASGQLRSSHIGFRESDTDKLENAIRNLLKQ